MSASFRMVALGIGLASAGGWFVYNQFFQIEELTEPNVIRRPKKRAPAPVEKLENVEHGSAEAPANSETSHSSNMVPPENEAAETGPPRHSTESLESAKTSATPEEAAPAEPAAQDVPPAHSTAALPEGTTDPDKRAWRQRLFAMLDLDSNGRLDSAELPERWRNELLESDSNGDGSLDFAEFDRAIIELAGRHPPGTFLAIDSRPASTLVAPPPAGKRVPVYVPGEKTKSDLPAWFLQRDKNEDGQIGIGEWPANQLDLFRRIDTNRDGFITPEEAIRAGTKIGDRMTETDEAGSGD